MTIKLHFLAFLTIFFIFNCIYSQDGTLDLSFGNGKGYTTTDLFNDDYEKIFELVLQNDGSIVVGGGLNQDYLIGIAKYTVNGILDQNFADGGKLLFNFQDEARSAELADIVVDSNNRIYILIGFDGNYEDIGENRKLKLIRLTEDGFLDETFGEGGVLTTTWGCNYFIGTGLLLQSDNKILISGVCIDESNLGTTLSRLNPDGSLDSTFGENGVSSKINNSIIYSMKFAKDGSIVGTGNIYDEVTDKGDMILVKFSSNGHLDSNFGKDGVVRIDINNIETEEDNDIGYDLDIQSDDKIVVVC